MVPQVDGFGAEGIQSNADPTFSIRYDTAQNPASGQFARRSSVPRLEFGFRGWGNTVPPTSRRRNTRGAIFTPEPLAVRRSSSSQLLLSPFAVAHRSGRNSPSRREPALSLFREDAVVIDYWMRFHRVSFGFHFRSTQHFETVRLSPFPLVLSAPIFYPHTFSHSPRAPF